MTEFVEMRCFHHICAIYIRNIDSKVLLNTFVNINLTNRNKTEIFKSETIYESLNPCFEFEEETIDEFKEKYLKEKEFTLTLFDKKKKLLSFSIHLEQVKYFSDSLYSHEYELPKNCLIIEFIDGFFIPNPIYSKYNIICNTTVSDERRETDIAKISAKDLENNILEISQLQCDIGGINSKVDSLKKKINGIISSQNFQKKSVIRQDHELRKKCCFRLENIIEEKNERVMELKKRIEKIQETFITKENQFLKSQNKLLFQESKLKEKRKVLIPRYKEKVELLKKKRRQRKRDIISEINKIYEIKVDGSNYTINDLKVYKNEQIETNEETYAALGYITHCVIMISKILQIPLQSKLFPKSSRSYIVEGPIFYRLFMDKNREKEKFCKAVGLLNLNIHYLTNQVINSKSVKIEMENNILKNLKRLIQTCINNLDD